MKLIPKIALGLLLGAILTLIIDPRSRPIFLAWFYQVGPSDILSKTHLIPQNSPVLQKPESLVDAGTYMLVGASTMDKHPGLSSDRISTLLRVVTSAEAAEPRNAFWPQMRAVFYNYSGMTDLAKEAWILASKKDYWRDYQVDRLLKIVDLMSKESGALLSWQVAKAITLRSDACTRQIRQIAAKFVTESGMNSEQDLLLRYATLENGRLIRDGAKTISSGQAGSYMIELSCYPAGSREPEKSPRKLILSRYQFVNSLRDRGYLDLSKAADKTFSLNEAWTAIVFDENIRSDLDYHMVASIFTTTLPSALFLISLIGTLIWYISRRLAIYPTLQERLSSYWLPITGAILSLALFALTHLFLFSVATFLCIGFLSFSPHKTRSWKASHLGPMFDIVCTVLAFTFISLLTLFFVGLTTPAYELGPAIDITTDYFGGQSLPLGLAFIVLCVLLVCAPIWAFVQRLRTADTLALSLRQFGSFTAMTCLIFGILSIPITLYLDRQYSETLLKMLKNEPNYFLLHERYSQR